MIAWISFHRTASPSGTARILSLAAAAILTLCPVTGSSAESVESEDFPSLIAVLPMTNMSLEEGMGEVLRKAVYHRLREKGYRRMELDAVDAALREEGISDPVQLAVFSPGDLGKLLKVEGVLYGQVDQAAVQHAGVMENTVFSASLSLVDGRSGRIVWSFSEKRAADRNFAIDPLNMLLNIFITEATSKKDAFGYLAQEMLKTMPAGPVEVVVGDDLLDRAVEIDVTTENTESGETK